MICRKLNPIAAAALVVIAQTSLQAMAQTPAPAEPAGTESGVVAENPAGQLKAVTVTAERRVANIQKTAIAMEVVGGADITEQGLSSGSEILKNVSNVEVQGAARGNVIAMRGVGSDLPPGMGESAVSTNYDGVYNFRAEMSTLGFFDLARVEVLRGPQGTLYGRNAAAGAVNYVTRDPELGKKSGAASLEIGSYGLMRSELGFNLPLGETLALRASGASVSRDGYLTDGFNDAKSTGGRVKLLWKPDSNVRVLAGAERIHLGGKGPGFIPQANWEQAGTRLQAAEGTGDNAGAEEVGYQDYNATKLWTQLDWNLGFANLTVLPSYQDGSGIVYRKYDASRPPGSEEQYNADPKVARQKSTEVRLSSLAGSAVQWVAGAYHYDMLNAQSCLLSAAQCAGSNNTRDTTVSKALFGQVSVPVTAAMRVVAGLRRTSDQKTSVGGETGDWSSTDGKLGLEYDVNPSTMAYATYATAYRPGGFNSLPGNSGTFDSEKLKSFELGVKSRWMDNTLQLNGALFRYDYKNYQAIDFAILNNGDLHASFLNVPSQTIQGLEAEAQVLLGKAGKLRASFTALDATLGDLQQTNPDGSKYSLKGNPLPHAPRLSVKAGYEYPIDLASGAQVNLRADVRYTDKQYISITENANTLQPAYTQLDLSTQYRSADDKWGINFYVKNATNYVVKTANFVGSTMVGAPRTYGVVLSTKF
jgi:iron complex outermembrane receptor protein